MAMPLNIDDYDFDALSDEEYADWAETMHVDPFEILDEFPTFIEGEVEE